MTLPVYLHSGMTGAPQLIAGNGNMNALLHACLVTGFNTQVVSSATASGGVVTFNFASAPGFSALDAVTIAGSAAAVADGKFRVQSAASNQVLVAIPGVPDGAVGGSITLKFSPLGWARPYSGTNLGAYQQGGLASHKRFLRVYDGVVNTTQRYSVRAYEAMTAISTGTGPFPTTAEAGGNGVEHIPRCVGAGNGPWFIVGTPRAFYLVNGYADDYTVATEWSDVNSARDAGALFFGECSRIQKPGDVYASVVSGSFYFPSGGFYAPRAYTGVSGSRPVQHLVGPGGQDYAGARHTYPDPASGGLALTDAPFIRETFNGVQCTRGFLPGILCPLNSLIDSNVPAVKLGSVITNVDGVTGRMVIGSGHQNSGGEFLLLLDEDWGDL